MKNMRLILSFVCAVFITFTINAQVEKYELTQTDITKIKTVKSRNLTVFGVQIGMQIHDIKNQINQNNNLKLLQDKYNMNRYYLNSVDSIKKSEVLAYLIFGEKDSVAGKDSILQEIIFYNKMASFFVGQTKLMLTEEAITPMSDLIRNFLGYADKKRIVVDIPSIKLKNYEYIYLERNFKIVITISRKTISYAWGLFL